MGFLIHGKYNYVFFTFYIQGKKYRYSTKIKTEKPEWDLATQRPEARRGDIGKANKKITFELNEYKRFYEKLKSDYKESLTKKTFKTKLDQHFQIVKALTY
tara:strand:+ start:196 stop:498 length:303 start_codon:yes stop_codon:yes gene_type:complete